MRILSPKRRANTLASIDLKQLRSEGFVGLLIDLDNTIVPWRQSYISEEAKLFIKEAKALGYKICLFTNAKSQRTIPISLALEIDNFSEAKKPFGVGFNTVIKTMGAKPEEVLMIGDQIFTDMLGGNRCGCYTILLPPISPNEFIGTKFLRIAERLCGYQQDWREQP